jgi:hypothetical protein
MSAVFRRPMRRVIILALLACLALPSAASASGPPGRATDFEDRVALGQGARSAARGVVVTDVLRAPRRFDLVGFRWGDRRPVDLEVRVRRDRGRWSPWTEAEQADGPAGASDPVWAGGADAYQLRLSRRPRGLRAHFVHVGRRASGARARIAAASPRQAAGAPAIVPRAAWGGDECAPRDTPSYGRVEVGFVHHTVTAASYGPGDSAAMVLAICRYHRNSNGWDDIGYNFLVDRYGQVFEGRAGGVDQAVVGAQTQGFNAVSTGVANLGTFDAAGQTPEGMRAMGRLLAWKLTLHAVPVAGTVTVPSAGGSANRFPAGELVAFERISGHRDGGLTACPGSALYAQLDELRAAATAHAATLPPLPTLTAPQPAFPTGGTLTLQASSLRVPYGQPAQVGGRFVAPDGTAMGGLDVAVQLRLASGYRTFARATTRSDGGWSASVPTRRSRVIRAVASAGGRRIATSRSLGVQVLPAIEAAAARRVVAGRVLVVRGRVRPAKGGSSSRSRARGGTGASTRSRGSRSAPAATAPSGPSCGCAARRCTACGWASRATGRTDPPARPTWSCARSGRPRPPAACGRATEGVRRRRRG